MGGIQEWGKNFRFYSRTDNNQNHAVKQAREEIDQRQTEKRLEAIKALNIVNMRIMTPKGAIVVDIIEFKNFLFIKGKTVDPIVLLEAIQKLKTSGESHNL